MLTLIHGDSTTAQNNMSSIASEKTESLWVTAYLAAWNHNAGTPNSNWGEVTTDQIKWDAITHMIYFALVIDSDGTPKTNLDPAVMQNFNADRLNAIVPAAHSNNTKILFSVGGAGNGAEFSSAIRPENRRQFFSTIRNIITTYGFDGVDIDMEPIKRSDYDNFRSFIRELRNELDKIKTNSGDRPLLTAAGTKGDGELFGSLNDSFDQVNIMSYGLVLPWHGWQTYHHTALFEGNYRLESTGAPFPSVDAMAKNYLKGGLNPKKLGIGMDFNGFVWKGVRFLEKWPGWPSQDLTLVEDIYNGGLGYSKLAERFNLSDAQWDAETQTSFLEIQNPQTFVAFDNERSIRRKVEYAKERGYGGIMIWSYAEDFMPDTLQPLLQAVKESVTK